MGVEGEAIEVMCSRSLSRMAMSSFDWRRVGPTMYGDGDNFGVPAPSENDRDFGAGDPTSALLDTAVPAGRLLASITATSSSPSPSTSDMRDRSSITAYGEDGVGRGSDAARAAPSWGSSSNHRRRRRSNWGPKVQHGGVNTRGR